MDFRIDREAALETGIDPARLDRVADLFRGQLLEERLHPGASLTIRKHGRIILEAWGGSMRPGADEPVVTPETLFLIFSATKPLTATAIHMLVERGQLDIEAPVADYWPGFAKNGKDAVTVRHVLTHQGGFPTGPGWLTWEHWRTREKIVRAMEERPLRWEPGAQTGYHALNFGWVLGELVHRIDGRSLGTFLTEEVFRPLDLRDSWLGLPRDEHPRVARLIDLSKNHQYIPDFNRPEVHAAECGAATGITTTRDLSRFYSMLVAGGEIDGVNLLKHETVTGATAVAVSTERDSTLGVPMNWGLGFLVARDPSPYGAKANARTFGHTGQGCTVGWGDPTRGLAVAYFTNGVQESVANFLRNSRMSDAILEATTPL